MPLHTIKKFSKFPLELMNRDITFALVFLEVETGVQTEPKQFPLSALVSDVIKAMWNVRPRTYEFCASPADLASPLAPDCALYEMLITDDPIPNRFYSSTHPPAKPASPRHQVSMPSSLTMPLNTHRLPERPLEPPQHKPGASLSPDFTAPPPPRSSAPSPPQPEAPLPPKPDSRPAMSVMQGHGSSDTLPARVPDEMRSMETLGSDDERTVVRQSSVRRGEPRVGAKAPPPGTAAGKSRASGRRSPDTERSDGASESKSSYNSKPGSGQSSGATHDSAQKQGSGPGHESAPPDKTA
jgi:hypothetical protein